MNIMSKAISSLLLLILIFYETRSKQNVLFKSLIISKLKLFFNQLFSTYFFTRVSLDADCRLLIAFIFYPNILVFLVLHLRSLNFFLQFPQVFKRCGMLVLGIYPLAFFSFHFYAHNQSISWMHVYITTALLAPRNIQFF